MGGQQTGVHGLRSGATWGGCRGGRVHSRQQSKEGEQDRQQVQWTRARDRPLSTSNSISSGRSGSHRVTAPERLSPTTLHPRGLARDPEQRPQDSPGPAGGWGGRACTPKARTSDF